MQTFLHLYVYLAVSANISTLLSISNYCSGVLIILVHSELSGGTIIPRVYVLVSLSYRSERGGSREQYLLHY